MGPFLRYWLNKIVWSEFFFGKLAMDKLNLEKWRNKKKQFRRSRPMLNKHWRKVHDVKEEPDIKVKNQIFKKKIPTMEKSFNLYFLGSRPYITWFQVSFYLKQAERPVKKVQIFCILLNYPAGGHPWVSRKNFSPIGPAFRPARL